MALATTQLARAGHHEDAYIWQPEKSVERKSLPMSRVVVTDNGGNRQLRMQWERRETADPAAKFELVTFV
jgi:hypothetical protein